MSPKELADIQRPFVKMVRLDFFFLFQGVLIQYATILNEELGAAVHKAKDPSAASALVIQHSDLITAWARRTQKDDASADLEEGVA